MRARQDIGRRQPLAHGVEDHRDMHEHSGTISAAVARCQR